MGTMGATRRSDAAWVAAVTGLGIILALAAPALSMNTVRPLTRALPTATPAACATGVNEPNRAGVRNAVVFPSRCSPSLRLLRPANPLPPRLQRRQTTQPSPEQRRPATTRTRRASQGLHRTTCRRRQDLTRSRSALASSFAQSGTLAG